MYYELLQLNDHWLINIAHRAMLIMGPRCAAIGIGPRPCSMMASMLEYRLPPLLPVHTKMTPCLVFWLRPKLISWSGLSTLICFETSDVVELGRLHKTRFKCSFRFTDVSSWYLFFHRTECDKSAHRSHFFWPCLLDALKFAWWFYVA